MEIKMKKNELNKMSKIILDSTEEKQCKLCSMFSPAQEVVNSVCIDCIRHLEWNNDEQGEVELSDLNCDEDSVYEF